MIFTINKGEKNEIYIWYSFKLSRNFIWFFWVESKWWNNANNVYTEKVMPKTSKAFIFFLAKDANNTPKRILNIEMDKSFTKKSKLLNFHKKRFSKFSQSSDSFSKFNEVFFLWIMAKKSSREISNFFYVSRRN